MPVPIHSASVFATANRSLLSLPFLVVLFSLLLGLSAPQARAQTLSSLTFSSTSGFGGTAGPTGTVTLTAAAATKITLSSSSPSLVLPTPPSATINVGSTSATFTTYAHSVSSATPVTVTATYNGVSKTATFTINPRPVAPALSSASVSPTNVTGGSANAMGTVTLSSAAPTGGVSVSLSSSSPSATVNTSVPVLAGSSTATFPVTTTSVTSATTATLTATYSGVSKTATLTVNPAATVPLYLSNLTINPTTVTGGSGATGTVTLSSPAPAGGITIPLTSDNSVVGVPTNVVIAGGATSKTFSITTNSVADTVIATLSATYNGWTQGEELSVLPTTLPAGLSFTMPPVHVAPGNGCAIVSWERLPKEIVNGYNVYRTSGTTKTRLTAKPFESNFYPITGLTNDTATYTYQVAAVDILGQEHTLSTPVTITPSSATETLNWINPPSTVTDRLLMDVALPSGGQVFGTGYYIDGQEFGGGGGQSSYVNGVQTHTAGAGFDSTKLSNGPHTVQFTGFVDADDTVACVTPPITIQASNTISNDSIDNNWFTPGQDLCFVSATVPASSTWTVQATSADGATVIRTWQGVSSSVNLAWDGKDAAGNTVPITDYALLLTVSPPGTSPQAAAPPSTKNAHATPNAAGVVKKNHPVKMLQGQTNGLALISVGASYYYDSNGQPVATPAQDIMLADVLTKALTTLDGAGNFQVIRSDTFDPLHTDEVDQKNKKKN